MGQLYSSPNLSARKEIRIFMHGVWGSGKKSILKKLELDAQGTPDETPGNFYIGDQVLKATYNNIQVSSWDVGGRCYSRAIARRYYSKGVDAMLFVIDSSEEYYLHQSRWILDMLFKEESANDAVFLILANKQDLPGALSLEKVAEELHLSEYTESHVTKLMGCSAETGEGLQEAMDWLAGELEKKKEREPVKETKKKNRSLISCVKNGFHALKAILPKTA